MGLPLVAVTADPLDLTALTRALAATAPGATVLAPAAPAPVAPAPTEPDATSESAMPGDGAVVSFAGLVRDQNQGRKVSFLEYEAYVPLAERALHIIVDEARTAWPDVRIAVHHRTGRLEIGEASIIIVAASPHRSEAFAACRYTIERVKQIVPIWKHEHFEGGDVWLEGAVADPTDEAAREKAYRTACA